MLPIFICENDIMQREYIEDIIKKYILIEDYDMEIVISTENPYDILDYLDNHRDVRGIYFLDIDLGQDIDGMQLGEMIRKKDIYSRIVFVTTHSELMSLTFQYKIEAMDYIVKDDPQVIQQKVRECLQRVHEYHTSKNINEEDRIKLKINNQIRVFQLKDIMFFETSDKSHKVSMHLTNSHVDLNTSLNDVETLSDAFVRVHKSYVVNKDNVVTIDQKNRELIMTNREPCMVSVRKIKLLT